jgi:uncharacterized membrane protein YecN with MAPEG domain
MVYPTQTAFYGAILALIYMAMSLWVVGGRVGNDTLIGDGGRDGLTRRIRAHGNFQEYVPFALILIGLLEAHGAGRDLVRILLIVLIVARLMHPVGMFTRKNSPQQFLFRGLGIVATFGVIIVASVALLLRLHASIGF